jgi:diguanylate cyclase (GGDEF)-like protein
MRKNFSIFLIDLDQFKSINEVFGHLRGDKVLQKFALILQNSLREFDLIFRYAGDEFVVLLPDMGRKESIKVAKKLIKEIGNRQQILESPIKITASIGISTFPLDGKESCELINVADKAMYEAKSKGGNTYSFMSKEKFTERDLLKWIHCDRLVGRSKELKQLFYIYEEMVSGKGRFVFINGEAGIGKTRLAEEFIKFAKLRGSKIFYAKCYETTSNIPYLPIKEGLKVVFEHSIDLKPIYLNEIRKLLSNGGQIETEHLPENKFRLYHALFNLFKASSLQKGIVLFIDDLHWADDATINFLRYLVRNITKDKILIIVTCREYMKFKESIIALKSEIYKERIGKEINLKALSKNDVKTLLMMTLKIDFPNDFIKNIYKETEGNPLFIEEVVSELIIKKQIYHDGEKVVLSVKEYPFPSKIETLIKSKLKTFDMDALNLLQYAAVYGKTVPYEILKAVINLNEGRIWEILDSAISKGLIVEISSEKFAFRHIKIQEMLYKSLSTSKRKKIHRQLVDVLERYDRDLDLLAYHSYLGQLWNKAYIYNKKASEKAKASYAYKEALEYIERCLFAAGKIDKDDKDLLFEKSKLLLYVGKPLESLKVGKTGLKKSKKSRDRRYEAKFLLRLAETAYELSDLENFRNFSIQAERIYRILKEEEGINKALQNIGTWYTEFGKFNTALNFYRRALKHALKEIDRVQIYNQMGMTYFYKGEIKKAFYYLKRALCILKNEEDKFFECEVLNNLGYINKYTGNHSSALDFYQESLRIARERGFRSKMPSVLNNIGLLWGLLGETGKAKSYLLEASEIEREIGRLRNQAAILNNIAILYGREGDFKNALKYYNQSLDIRMKLNDLTGAAITKSNIGNLHLCSGDIKKAHGYHSGALRLISKGSDERAKLYIERNFSQLLICQGKYKEAINILRRVRKKPNF